MADDLDDVAGPDDLEDLDDDTLTETDDDIAEDDPELAAGELEEDGLDAEIDDTGLADPGVTDTPSDGSKEESAAADPQTAPERHEDGDEDEEEEPEDEDVEASLDVILKERLVVEDEVEDEEVTETEERGEPSERVRPKQPDEFVCRSCFLVKHPSQLADQKRLLCRDCV